MLAAAAQSRLHHQHHVAPPHSRHQGRGATILRGHGPGHQPESDEQRLRGRPAEAFADPYRRHLGHLELHPVPPRGRRQGDRRHAFDLVDATADHRVHGGPVTADEGLHVDGQPLVNPADKIAFVFQQDGLLPWRSVLRNAGFGPELKHKPTGEITSLATKYLRLVGLGQFPDHFPHELSGGMRQRVNIARALSAGADILLMDEPFAALDSQTREIMQTELLRIWSETQKTVLLVTHQIDEAVYLSDRILIFTSRPGRLKEDIQINLPRPRDLSIKRTPEFTGYTDHIWRAIEAEVRSSIEQELMADVRT